MGVSFDHLGTFNRSQLNRLSTYALAQVQDVDARIAHLTAEQARIGTIVFQYDKASVVGYEPSPEDSYLGKLLRAYEVLGGDPFYDLKLRQKGSQALYVLRADETRPAQVRSDGLIIAREGLADAPSAALVQQLRDWMHESLQYKRETLERKIRRALDYSDQISDEIAVLTAIKGDATVAGSAKNILQSIQQLVDERTYRAIADDKGKDPDGTLTHAPFAALEPGPQRTVIDGYYRTLDGYVTPNDGTDNPTNNS